MNTIANRIRILRVTRGISQLDLAKRCGVTNVTVSRWESGNLIPNRHLAVLAAALGVTADWLLGGEGNPPEGAGNTIPLNSSTGEPALARVADSVRETLAVVEELRHEQQSALRARYPQWECYESDEGRALPFWLGLAAGPGRELEGAERGLIVEGAPKRCSVFRVQGDSMITTIRPDDLVICQSLGERGVVLPPLDRSAPKTPVSAITPWLKHRRVYVVGLNDEPPTLKRALIARSKAGWHLVISADNPDDPRWPYVVEREDVVTFYAELLAFGVKKHRTARRK